MDGERVGRNQSWIKALGGSREISFEKGKIVTIPEACTDAILFHTYKVL